MMIKSGEENILVNELKLKVSYLGILFFILIYLVFYIGPIFLDLEKLLGSELDRVQNHENVVNSNLKDINIKLVATIFIGAFIQQALSEEIVFRGFIYGRLANVFNVNTAIIIQAVIFGLVHNLLFYSIRKSLRYHILLFFIGGIGGLLFAILNNIIFNGSIIPSIILHGLGNFITGIIKLKRE